MFWWEKRVQGNYRAGQPHLGINCYIAMTSQIGRFFLRTSEKSQRRLK